MLSMHREHRDEMHVAVCPVYFYVFSKDISNYNYSDLLFLTQTILVIQPEEQLQKAGLTNVL